MLRRLGVAATASLAVLLGVAGPASALLVWTLVATPLVATQGQHTTFTLTATNLDLLGELGCLEVVLPGSGWTDVEAGEAVPSTGREDWAISVTGTTVVAWSTSGGGRLETGQWVTFTFSARANLAGISTWPNHAHQRQDCAGADEVGVPIAITVAPVIGATPAPTPSATAKPVPTPTPTPRPTAEPTPKPTTTARPSPGSARPTPSPSTDAPASPAVDQAATARPSATPEADADAAQPPSADAAPPGRGPADPGAGTGTDGEAGAPPQVPVLASVVGDEESLEVSLGALGALGGVDVWIVPAATLAGPGLIILVWIGLQAAGVLAWLPAVRRLRGDDEASPR